MKLFVDGRKSVFRHLKTHIYPNDKIIWMHAASLGEYEQGVPVLQELRKSFPQHKILLSFFSPSGYEVKKNTELADIVTYLPIDTKAKAKKFIELSHPDLALFVKYEVWPNYLSALKNKNIPSLLISGNFRKDQIFFKSQAGFMKKALGKFDHLFVQNKDSEMILKNNGFTQVSISGDTRFDRVSEQLQRNNHLDFIEDFKNNKLCIVAGSTWPEDENILMDFINSAPNGIKFIIAPHEIKQSKIQDLQSKIKKSHILFSEKQDKDLKDYEVLIIDTVGLLTRIYSYADIAYVGGAAGNTGLHNILEPAAFGVPVIIGKNHQDFPEAGLLLKHKGLFSVKDANQTSSILNKLISDHSFRQQTGRNSADFIKQHQGATKKIMKYIKDNFNFLHS